MKISVFIAVSVDGYIAKPDGDIEWLNNPKYNVGKLNGINFDEFISTVDTIIMGRNTFEKVLTFGVWPYEGIDVIVLSNRELSVPENLRNKVRKKSGDVCKIVEELEKSNKKHLYIDGGNTIQNFLRVGKVDEIILTIIPILLGEGISLFGALKNTFELSLIESKSSVNGFVQNRYSLRNG